MLSHNDWIYLKLKPVLLGLLTAKVFGFFLFTFWYEEGQAQSYIYTRESVARVANSYHDKKLVFKFGMYIYHRYIYISRPPPRGADRHRCTDCRLKE